MGRSSIERDNQGRKRCSRCKEYKPLREFYSARHTRDGKAGYCVDCNKEATKLWKQKHSSGNKVGRPRSTKPKIPKKLTAEEKLIKRCEYGWIPSGAITRRCTHCKRLRVQEVIKEGVCAVCSRKKPAKKRSCGRPRKYKELTAEGRKRAYMRTDMYRATHKAYKHRRDARVKAGGSFTGKEWRDLLESYNNTCLCCKRTDVKLTPDHVKPLALGGLNTIDNIQPLCMECNTKKGATEVDYR